MWPIEYAIVSTVRQKASETPSKPIPTCGNPAAMTAEPQPANVSQNVPIASATYFLIWSIGCSSLFAQGHAKTNLNTVYSDPLRCPLPSGSPESALLFRANPRRYETLSPLGTSCAARCSLIRSPAD